MELQRLEGGRTHVPGFWSWKGLRETVLTAMMYMYGCVNQVWRRKDSEVKKENRNTLNNAALGGGRSLTTLDVVGGLPCLPPKAVTLVETLSNN
jgi:hypothetical protein